MIDKPFELTTNSSNIQMLILPLDEFVLSINNMLISDILASNFSLEELSDYLKKQGKLRNPPVDIFSIKRNFSIKANSSEIRTYIYPSGKFSITMPNTNRWKVLRDNLAIEEIAGYINERIISLRAAAFFNNN